jgi:replication-associated recombination protein RarA
MQITEVYRPRRLSEVAAQKSAVVRIENSVARRGLAGSSWWISGATGTGKTTIARILAEEFCGNDFTVIEFVGRDLLVDDIREYERRMAFTPMGGGRCLIINEAQDLSDMSVSMLLSLVEKINESKYDMVVFTALVDVLENKNDSMNRWRALVGRCNQVKLADTDSPVFRQEVVEYLEGVAANEGIRGVDVQGLCEMADWSIRAALNALDMQDRYAAPPVVAESAVKPVTGQSEVFAWYAFYGTESDSVLAAYGDGGSCRSALARACASLKKVSSDHDSGFVVSVERSADGGINKASIYRFVQNGGKYSWTPVKKSDESRYMDVLVGKGGAA